MSDSGENIDFIVDKINKGKCIAFCGAGISRKSGILTVEPLLKKMFEYLHADQEDVNAYLYDKDGRFNLPIPFEAIVQSLKNNIKFVNSDISFIQVFARLFNGEPNLNHYLLANLLKENKIHCVVTTNFDTCIEQALGWSEGDNRIIIPYQEQLEWLEEIDLRGKIIKLHGCKTLPDLLGTTVSQITKPTFMQKTNLILRKIFCSDLFDTTLFLGYSCSDKWDISQFFNNCRINNLHITPCIYWQHTNNPEEQKTEPNVAEMLKNHNCQFMFGDTSELVENLWNNFGYIRALNPVRSDSDFCLKEYLTEDPEFVLNQLFQDSNLHNIAKKYCLKAIETYNNKLAINHGEYIYKFIKSIKSFGDYYEAIHDTKNAENFYGAAIQFTMDNIEQDKENLTILWPDLIVKFADALVDNGKTDEAEKHYLLAIDFYEKYEMFIPPLASIYNNIALLYEQTAPQKAYEYFQKALEIYEKEAKVDPVEYDSSVAMTLNNIAMFYWKNNEHTEAIRFIEHSLNIYRNLAIANAIYEANIGEGLLNLGLIYRDLGKVKEAQSAYEEAIAIQKNLAMIFPEKHLPKLSLSLSSLSRLYLDIDPSQAYKIEEEALEIRRKSAQNKNAPALSALANSLIDLGHIGYRLKKYEQARIYLKEALPICRRLVKINEKQYLIDLARTLIIYCNISEKIDQHEVTDKWYRKLFVVIDKILLWNEKRYSDIPAIANFNFANYKSSCGITTKAIKHYKIALEIYDTLFHKDPDNYYIKVTELYHKLILQLDEKELNDFIKNAFVTLTKSMTIFLHKNSNNLPIKYINDFSSIAIKLGIIYYENGNYYKSKNVYIKALTIINSCHSISNYDYHINQGLIYCELANTMLRIQEINWNPAKEAIQKIENTYLKSYIAFHHVAGQFSEHDRLNFSILLTTLAKFYEQTDDFDKAITYLELSVQSYEELCKISSTIEYMQRLSNAKYFLFRAYISKSDNNTIEKAEKCLLDMLEINTKMSEIDSDYSFWLGGAQITIAEFYKDHMINREKSILFAQRAYKIFKEYEFCDDFKYDMERVNSVIEYWNKN